MCYPISKRKNSVLEFFTKSVPLNRNLLKGCDFVMLFGNLKSILAFIMSVVMLISNLFLNPPVKPFVPGPDIITPVEVETMNITQNNLSDYVIVHGANCGASELNAANTLQGYIAQICGVTLPVVTDANAPQAKEIIVGKTNREVGGGYTVDRASLGDEGLMIKTVGQKLIIAGGEKRGTLYGVYTFLEEVLGCHWYTSTLIVIPHMDDLKIPVDINITEKPTFEYRETDWLSPHDQTYSIANKLNGNTYRQLSDAQGGTMGYTGGFCHTLTNSILPASQYFATHPEYYAWNSDTKTRDPNQLCLTNPDVLRLVIQQVRDILAANPNTQIISLTQNDNGDYCTCDNCKAIDAYEGSHSGTLIHFVNAVADAIKDDYPNVAIDTFAYQYTRKPPLHVVPRANVIVRLCSIECCFAHPLSDTNCADNANFNSDLLGWQKLCNRIYIWDYTTNYSNFLGPFNNFGVIQQNMQFFAENNVKGIYEEGNYMASQCNAEFAELRAYMLAKLLWNPNLDYDKTMNDFLRAYYGKGWQYVREYIDMTIKKSGNNDNHMHIGENMTAKGVFNLTRNEVEYCNNLWTKAASLAQTETQLKNVKMSELSWRYWKGCNMVSEFSRLLPVAQWRAANKALYDDYAKYGIVRFSEGSMLSAAPNFNLSPSDWK
jgi:hypothetical protein